MCVLCATTRAITRIPRVSKAVQWHGSWCPAWKAWNEVYGEPAKATEETQ